MRFRSSTPASAIARRFLRQKSIFAADRGHIHHRLLDRGFTPRKVVLILYAVAGLFAILSLCTVWAPNVGLVIVLFCACTWIGIQHLGYLEFGVAGRMFMDGAFRRLLNSHLSLQAFEQDLSAASTPEECWRVLSAAYKEFGFCRIEATIAETTYSAQDDNQQPEFWAMRIPLAGSDQIELFREFDFTQQQNVLASFVDVLRKVLVPKLATFPPHRQPAQSVPTPTFHTARTGD